MPKHVLQPDTKEHESIDWFRHAAPYIYAHRQQTFVFYIPGELAENITSLTAFIHDIALLSALGIQLVIVHGARPQIEAKLTALSSQWRYVDHRRITDSSALVAVIEACATIRTRLEALLSTGMANTPMSGMRLRVSSGNSVVAKPLGILNGVDYQFTGEVRRIDTQNLRSLLELGHIVLLSPLGYSPTGEVFNLTSTEVATATATALHADKLIFLEEAIPHADDQQALRQLSTNELKVKLTTTLSDYPNTDILSKAAHACEHGVDRVHLINFHDADALLAELFTRNGRGLLISNKEFETLRQATIQDIGGILELIEPLEKQGILVRRSREQLELEISHFTVIEREGAVIACAALYPYPEDTMAELACLAVANDYRHEGLGDRLLRQEQLQAQQMKLKHIFVLTTQSAHWFQERGFHQGDIKQLPDRKRTLYNYQRNSRVFFKPIEL